MKTILFALFLSTLAFGGPYGRGPGVTPGGSGGSGISSLNGLTDTLQTFATGTSGSDFAISSGSGIHTFNIPDAGASARGMVSTGSQTLAGVKTFSSAPICSSLTASTVPYLDSNKQLASSAITPTELGYLSGVSSALQTQLNAKAPSASPTFTGTITTPLTASRVMTTNASSQLAASTVTTTQLGYLDATSSIQTQLDGKEPSITTLSVAKGGTNSGTSLNNNRVMKSSGGAIVEASAITASRALVSDANGIPTHSTTTATEIGYVNGVTSAIQTQIDALKVQQIDGMIETPSNKTYPIRLKAKFAATINEISLKTASGTITAKLTINGVDVTGCTAISVTSTASLTSCTAANTVASGDTINLVTTSNSSAADLQFSVKLTR